MGLKSNLLLWKEYLKIGVSTAMEYRFNFIVQSISMALNDAIWIAFWWILFSKFPVIQGWELSDIIILYAVLITSFGISGVLMGNRSQVSTIIAEGGLDFYLSLPKNELFHVLISKSDWYSMGDLGLGIILAGFFLRLEQWPLFLLLVVFAAVIITSYNVISGSLAFIFGHVEETSKTLNMSLISFGSYPLDIYTGVTKFILLTLIPAGFVSSIPAQILKTFSWEWMLLLAGVSVIFLVIAIVVFKLGLKRYESGNMIYTRM